MRPGHHMCRMQTSGPQVWPTPGRGQPLSCHTRPRSLACCRLEPSPVGPQHAGRQQHVQRQCPDASHLAAPDLGWQWLIFGCVYPTHTVPGPGRLPGTPASVAQWLPALTIPFKCEVRGHVVTLSASSVAAELTRKWENIRHGGTFPTRTIVHHFICLFEQQRHVIIICVSPLTLTIVARRRNCISRCGFFLSPQWQRQRLRSAEDVDAAAADADRRRFQARTAA